MREPSAASYLESFAAYDVPLVKATPESLKGYGIAVTDCDAVQIEIVTWPAQGRRPVDEGTGNEGGITEGLFEFWWSGDVLRGRNHAVNDSYLIGWTREPHEASEAAPNSDRSQILIWRANYHPDGGQLFYPRDGKPFVAPLALPGDDISPESFVAFYCDGSFGLYVHPGVWHEATFPLDDTATFYGKQGKVHARVTCDFVKEFGVYLRVPMRRAD